MTPADVEADRKDGTPGPWVFETKQTSCGVCHQIGPWPHPWRGGKTMSACIYDDYPPPGGTDAMLANARRIARVPELEDAYLAHTARIAALEARAAKAEALLDIVSPLADQYRGRAERLRAALINAKDKLQHGLPNTAIENIIAAIAADTPTKEADHE